jgi:hypothetical protein
VDIGMQCVQEMSEHEVNNLGALILYRKWRA